MILGLNAYHGDSSACVVREGVLVAAAEEERFRRVKHWAGFPSQSIKYCLSAAEAKIGDVDHIAINRKPSSNLLKKAVYSFSKKPSFSLLKERLKNSAKMQDIRKTLIKTLDIREPDQFTSRIHYVEHHLAHLGSSFYVSPFDSATVVSVDGFGDFVSTMWGVGEKNDIVIKDQVYFPHSLGLFYLAITQYLGFLNYGDEYKVMGLAPYGEPIYAKKLRRVVQLKPEGRFELGLDYFLHQSEGVSMVWDHGEPKLGAAYSEHLVKLLGPARKPNEELQQRHKDIAASMQEIYEEAFFHLLNDVYEQTKNTNLCLAGGCAMNSVANGKIFERTKFKELYIQPAAGDAGGAIGAAYYVWHSELGNPRSFEMKHAYWGPEFSEDSIQKELDRCREELKIQNCLVEKIIDINELCCKTALQIAEGKVVGWFQGRMEWGPRALGNRSILCDPRRSDMKDILNMKIKRRESFRPFAPSILREYVSDWFETDYDVPFMLQVYQIREQKRKDIPAVTHVNGSGRLQTVSREQNQLYYDLITQFYLLTGIPMLLNTSFNENEPIVCKPCEAIDVFLRTKMDVLVLGSYYLERRPRMGSVD